MPQNLLVGRTHDVVLHVNDSVQVGLMIRPGSFRVTNAPSFIPRFAVGDPRGIDFNKWRKFVQNDFSGGMGQLIWGSPQGNNRYAQSSLVDIGLPSTAINAPINRRGGILDIIGPSELVDEAVGRGIVSIAQQPVGTSSNTPILITNSFQVFILPFSNRPNLIHTLVHAVHTNPTIMDEVGDFASDGGTPHVAHKHIDILGTQRIWAGAKGSPFVRGNWAVINTVSGVDPILSAIIHSNTVLVSSGHSYGISAYGSTNGIGPSYVYKPLYSTSADQLFNFDSKMWRTYINRFAYLDPVAQTGVWSNYFTAGDTTSYIINTATFGGRLYLGKEDALWAFEAGRVFMIEDFSGEADISNFNLMVSHRGSLYFNIRHRLFRLTGGGLIEVIPTPEFDGYIISGVSIAHELFILLRDQVANTRVWIYDSDAGGVREWVSMKDVSLSQPQGRRGTPLGPTSIQSLYGHVWLAPVYLTNVGVGATTSPIATLNRLAPPSTQASPNFYNMGERAFLITSLLDMGYPSVDKLLNSLTVDYNLISSIDSIDVFYLINELGRANLTAAWVLQQPSTFVDLFTKLFDGQTGASAPFDPTTFQVASGSSDELYFGFREPTNRIFIDIHPSQPAPLDGDGTQWINDREYWNGSAWVDLPRYYEAPAVIVNGFQHYFARSVIANWVIPNDWSSTTVNGASAYYIRYRYTHTGSISTTLRIAEIRMGNTWSRFGTSDVSLEDLILAWNKLGTISDRTAGRQTFNFPRNTVARQVMFKFIFRGGQASRPELIKYELEWAPIGPERDLARASFVALGIDNIKLLNGAVENSSYHIHRSIFSMKDSGLTYIAQFPYPPPVAHTRRVTVSIADPGVSLPTLAFGHTNPEGASLEADIPLILDEM